MDPSLSILLLDDCPDEHDILSKELEAAFSAVNIQKISKLEDFKPVFQNQTVDLVITNAQMKWANGFQVIGVVKSLAPLCPIIVFNGAEDEESALAAMKAGAADYVIKSEHYLRRLNLAVRAIWQQKNQRQELQQAEERYRSLFEQIPIGLYRTTPDGKIIDANPALIDMLKIPDEAQLNEIRVTDFYANPRERLQQQLLMERDEVIHNYVMRLRRLDGELIWVQDNTRSIRDEQGNVLFYEGALEDITNRTLAEYRVARISENFLSFSAQPLENINRLTALCGELLGADCALYNRLDQGMLCSWGQWNTPADNTPQDKPEGHICYSVILSGSDEVQLIRDLPATSFAQTDPSVMPYGLKTYLGKGVKLEQKVVGSLCMLYQRDFIPSNEDLKVIGILSAAIGVEERRRNAELARRESDERYGLLFRHSPVGFFLYDNNLVIKECNDRFVTILQSSREQLINLDMHRLRDIRVLPALESALQGQEGCYEGIYHATTSEAKIHVSMITAPIYIRSGEVSGGVGIVEDITARKIAEREIAHLAAVVEQSTAAILITNPKGQIVYANPYFEQLTGFSRAEVIGIPADQSSYPRIGSSFREKLMGAVLSNSKWKGTLVDARKDGSRYHQETNIFPIMDSEGQTINFACVIQDVTDRVRAQEQIQRHIQHLAALRTVDMTISASLDLRVTFGILLDQVQNQLKVDAAVVLLFNPNTQKLEYAISRGLHGNSIQNTSIRLGEGLPGKAALERCSLSNLNLRETTMKTGSLHMERNRLAGEGFFVQHVIPLVARGQVKGVLEVFHRSPFTPDTGWIDFLDALAGQAAIAIDNSNLYDDLQRSSFELSLAYDSTLEIWSQAIGAQNQEGNEEGLRISRLAYFLAVELGLKEEDLLHIRRGAFLHDIGMMAVPQSILLKTGLLTPKERRVIEKHPITAFQMLTKITYLHPSIDIPYCHHERWDGSGYPRGLVGSQIPLAARIFAVVDVWEALTSVRPHRPAWSKQSALAYLAEKAGVLFDPHIVEVFLNLLESHSDLE